MPSRAWGARICHCSQNDEPSSRNRRNSVGQTCWWFQFVFVIFLCATYVISFAWREDTARWAGCPRKRLRRSIATFWNALTLDHWHACTWSVLYDSATLRSTCVVPHRAVAGHCLKETITNICNSFSFEWLRNVQVFNHCFVCQRKIAQSSSCCNRQPRIFRTTILEKLPSCKWYPVSIRTNSCSWADRRRANLFWSSTSGSFLFLWHAKAPKSKNTSSDDKMSRAHQFADFTKGLCFEWYLFQYSDPAFVHAKLHTFIGFSRCRFTTDFACTASITNSSFKICTAFVVVGGGGWLSIQKKPCWIYHCIQYTEYYIHVIVRALIQWWETPCRLFLQTIFFPL